MKQDAPFAAQIELVEGCNLRCTFCGVNGIRGTERTYKYMTLKTANNIAKAMSAAGWNPRIEFAMHGEPTLHPDAPAIVAIFRKWFPKNSILMLSNGGGLVKESAARVAALMAAGLNTLGLDEYDGINLVPKIMEQVKSTPGYEVFTYPDDPDGNPHRRTNVRRVVHIRPINTNTEGTHATLNNHAGAGAPKNDRGMGKRCAKPFREIAFRWDGSVAICCNDWRGELALGNINTDTLASIWDGPVAQAARKKLYNGLRDFGPCNGCDATSYRVGLLPDKMGKQTLPKPSKKDLEVLATALRRKPLTKPVKREWE